MAGHRTAARDEGFTTLRRAGLVVAAFLLAGCPRPAPESDCTDTRTDPKNCGSCGHDCQGGTCNGGACEPVRLYLFNGSESASLAVDATSVYWTDGIVHFGIQRGPKLEPALIEYLGAAYSVPVGLVVSPSAVYWTDAQSRRVVEYRLTVPSEVAWSEFIRDLPGPVGLAFDDNNIYLTTNDPLLQTGGGAVYKNPIQKADSPVAIASGYDYVTEIVADGDHVYFVVRRLDGSGGHDVVRVAIDASDPTIIAHDLGDVSSIALFDGTLYMTSLGAILSVPAGSDGLVEPTTLVSGLAGPRSVQVDESGVYFAHGDCLRTVARTGGESECVIERQVYQIALDPTAIYWTEPGSVMKLAK
jgi:hypothetical protein